MVRTGFSFHVQHTYWQYKGQAGIKNVFVTLLGHIHGHIVSRLKNMSRISTKIYFFVFLYQHPETGSHLPSECCCSSRYQMLTAPLRSRCIWWADNVTCRSLAIVGELMAPDWGTRLPGANQTGLPQASAVDCWVWSSSMFTVSFQSTRWMSDCMMGARNAASALMLSLKITFFICFLLIMKLKYEKRSGHERLCVCLGELSRHVIS